MSASSSDVEQESHQEPLKKGIYTLYHGTSVVGARLIINNGFRQSSQGLLGRGVYFSRDKGTAGHYPLDIPHTGRVVLEVRVQTGRVKRIDTDFHPMQMTWHENGYNTAWVPPNCNMRSVPSGCENICVFNPKRAEVVGIAKAPNIMIRRDLQIQSEASRMPGTAAQTFDCKLIRIYTE